MFLIFILSPFLIPPRYEYSYIGHALIISDQQITEYGSNPYSNYKVY
jgi:hypothetical protein